MLIALDTRGLQAPTDLLGANENSKVSQIPEFYLNFGLNVSDLSPTPKES